VVILADYIAFGFFDLYHYHPRLLADELADSALGEFLADILFVPSLTIALAAWFPRRLSLALGTFIVTALEGLFVPVGLFHQTGWRLWLTAALFPAYFYGIDLFRRRAHTKGIDTPLARGLIRSFLVVDTLAILTLYIRAQRLVMTNIHLLPTQQGNQAFGRFVTYIIPTGALGYWALSDRQVRPARLAAITLGLIAFNYTVSALHFQSFRHPWSEWADALAQGGAIYLAGLGQDWLYPHARVEA
ncbi:MAG TPA: hypothetical protein VK464_27765, partial [Symbiobacteriaceae bacterium]|nr:hypothetical protein [Symbiobacteriaceae bacterium]